MRARLFLNESPLLRMTREMDRVFDLARPLSASSCCGTSSAGAGVALPITAWQDETAIHVQADLPGYRLEDVEILAHDQTLAIRGKREVGTPEGATTLRAERVSSEFERTIGLPSGVNLEQVSASLRDGVLQVTLPLTPEVKPRRVQIAG